MKITLDQILDLAGNLDDEDSRARFRRFLQESAKDVAVVGKYVDVCLKAPDEQHRLALSDLICHLGCFLGFEVDFDGHWRSTTEVHFILEPVAKGGEVEVGDLLGRIGDEAPGEMDSVLGLYVVWESDLEAAEETIVDEDEEGRIRTISIFSLLRLAEIVKGYGLRHEDALLIILSSGPSADPLIDIMDRLIARCEAALPSLEDIAYLLGPGAGSAGETSPEENLQDLIDQGQYYAFGNGATGRRVQKR